MIKFQTHIAEAESSLQEPFRVKFSYEDETRFDYWKRMEFTISQWEEIKNHCELVGLEFMSSPFSLAAVDLLENLNVNRYKIASGEINNLLMLEKIARTGKPIILSSGMSSFSELEKTIEFLKPFGNELSIMQCTTAYPTAPEQVGLNVIKLMQEKFRLMTGLSDHSGTIFPSLAAVTLGASLIEVHAVFHKKIFGPDTIASLTIEELTELVKGVRFISKAIDNPIDKNENGQFVELKKIFEKTLAVNKNLTVGHILTQDDLESKKPTNCGLPVSDFKRVIGRKLKKSLNRYDFLKKEDLENE